MTPFELLFLVAGLLIGFVLGVIAMALGMAARQGDQMAERWLDQGKDADPRP